MVKMKGRQVKEEGGEAGKALRAVWTRKKKDKLEGWKGKCKETGHGAKDTKDGRWCTEK